MAGIAGSSAAIDSAVGVSAALEAVTGGITELISPLAGITKSFTDLAGQVSQFVTALSPGTMQVFNLALRDLQATIGVALLPVIQVLTEGLHQAAGLLLPAMQQLAPIFRQLAQIFLSVMLPAVNAVSVIFQALVPVFNIFLTVMKAYEEAIGTIVTLYATLAETLINVFVNSFGGDFKTFADKLKEAIYQVTGLFLRLAAAIATGLGLRDFVDNLLKNLNNTAAPPIAGAGGAAQNISLKGLEQITKDLSIAAASATAGGGSKNDGKGILDHVAGLAADLEKIKNQGFAQSIIDAFGDDKVQKAIDAAFVAGAIALWHLVKPNSGDDNSPGGVARKAGSFVPGLGFAFGLGESLGERFVWEPKVVMPEPLDLANFLETTDDKSTSSASASDTTGVSSRSLLLRDKPTAAVLRNATSTLIGYTNAAISPDGRLQRVCPPMDPVYPNWYATGYPSQIGIGEPTLVATDLNNLPINQPTPFPFYAAYDSYEFKVNFSPRSYPVLTDQAIQGNIPLQWTLPPKLVAAGESDIQTNLYANEWLRYSDFGLAAQNESITAVQGMSVFQTQSGKAPNGAVFQGMPRLFQPNQLVKINWYQVPLRYWISANSFLRKWVGYINQFDWYDWDGVKLFDSGTLLYLGGTPKIYTSLAAQLADDGQGDLPQYKFMDVEMTFIVTQRAGSDVPQDLASKNFIAAGHNLQAFFPTGKYYYITFGNGVLLTGTNNVPPSIFIAIPGGLPPDAAGLVGYTVTGPGMAANTKVIAVDAGTPGLIVLNNANTFESPPSIAMVLTSPGTAVPYWNSFPFEFLFTDPDTPQNPSIPDPTDPPQ